MMRLFWLWILASIHVEYASAQVGAGAAADFCVAGPTDVLRAGAGWNADFIDCIAAGAEEASGDASELRVVVVLNCLASSGIRLTMEINWLDVVAAML